VFFLFQVAATMSQRPLFSAIWHIARFVGLVAVVLILVWRAPSDSDPGRLGQNDITMMRDGDQRVIGIELNKGDLYEGLADDIAIQSSLKSFHGKDLDCTDELISALTPLPNLKSVRLERCNVTTAQLQMLSQLPLKLFSLSDSKGPESGRSSLETHADLTDLDLSGCDWIHDEDLASLTKLPELQSLDLSRTRISNSGLQVLAECDSINRINLSFCSQLNSESLKTLKLFPHLQQVTITAVPLNLQAAAEFQQLRPNTILTYDQSIAPDLQPLIAKCSLDAQNLAAERLWGRVPETGPIRSLELHLPETMDLTPLQFLPQLEALRLTGEGVSDSALAGVFLSRNLKTLNLSDSRCSDEALAGIHVLHSLERLTFNNVTIGTKTLQSVAKLPNLKMLDLNGATINIDQRIEAISFMKLDSLSLNHATGANHLLRQIAAPQLAGLSLVSCNIYDYDVASLSKFPALTTLDLSENPIQGETLDQLASLPIASLVAENTVLSDPGLAQLAHWRGLHSLYLTASPFNGSGFKDCPDLNVRYLKLSRVNLNDEGVTSICKLNGTEWLGLEGSTLPPKAIQRFTNDPEIKQLVLDGSHLTSDQLPGPVRSESLVSLTIRAANPEQLLFLKLFERVKGLTLIDCQLGAESTRTLSQTRQITSLSFTDCEISNEAFQILTASDTLEQISLQGRGIDDLDRCIVDTVRPTLNIQFIGSGDR
jgi:hypothetical protein